jgi:hypothetical protein
LVAIVKKPLLITAPTTHIRHRQGHLSVARQQYNAEFFVESTALRQDPLQTFWKICIFTFINKELKMLTKNKVAALVEHMPDTFSVDDLVERVLLLQKIEQAQKEIENGEGVDWEDFKKEMEQW